MKSPLRIECQNFIEDWVRQLPDHNRVLDVGIAGDPKPGGNYYLFQGKKYQTSDVDAQYKPTYVFDIQYPPVTLNGEFDVVVLSNTLEHIYDTRQALQGASILLKEGGTLIVDCPWQYPYHAEDGFEDYWRISAPALGKLLHEIGFSNVEVKQGIHCTSAMAVK